MMAQIQLQIMSDLHLETPKTRPGYEHFDIEPKCDHLALLGDIGRASADYDQLSAFLTRQLLKFRLVLYIIGNHEAYGATYQEAEKRLLEFEQDNNQYQQTSSDCSAGKFILLSRKRYDLSLDVTILGCTLFSRVVDPQRLTVSRFVSDFSRINSWTIEDHNRAHQTDISWLNTQVGEIERHEPHRSIVILTHHSPTALLEANDPRHLADASQVQSAFTTDLSSELCWTSDRVTVWAFGHTHFNCDFVDSLTSKRVVTNQRGYHRTESPSFEATKLVSIGSTASEQNGRSKKQRLSQLPSYRRSSCAVV